MSAPSLVEKIDLIMDKADSAPKPRLQIIQSLEDQKLPPKEELDNLNRLVKLYCFRYKAENSSGKDESFMTDPLAREKILDDIAKAEESAFSNRTRFSQTLRLFRLCKEEKRIVAMLFVDGAFSQTASMVRQVLDVARDDLTVGQVLSLICGNFEEQAAHKKYFSVGSELIQRSLISFGRHREVTENILNFEVGLRERVSARILGDSNIYSHSTTAVRWVHSTQAFESVILPDEITRPIRQFLDNYDEFREESERMASQATMSYGLSPSFLFCGPSGTGKTMLAKGIANYLGRKLFTIDPGAIDQCRNSLSEVIRHSFIEAQLQDGVLYFDEADDIFQSDTSASRELLIELENARCITIFSTNDVQKLDSALERRILFKYRFPFPDLEARIAMWSRFFAEAEISCEMSEIESIAKRYVMPGGYIKNTVLYLMSQVKKTGKTSPATPNMIHQAAEYFFRRFQQGHGEDSHQVPVSEYAAPTAAELKLIESKRSQIEPLAAAIENYSLPVGVAEWLGCNASYTVGVRTENLNEGVAVAKCLAHSTQRPYLIVRLSMFRKIVGRELDMRKSRCFSIDEFLDRASRIKPVFILVIDSEKPTDLVTAQFQIFWQEIGTWGKPRFLIRTADERDNSHYTPEYLHEDYVLSLSDVKGHGLQYIKDYLVSKNFRDIAPVIEGLTCADYSERVLQAYCKQLCSLSFSGESPSQGELLELAVSIDRMLGDSQPLFGND